MRAARNTEFEDCPGTEVEGDRPQGFSVKQAEFLHAFSSTPFVSERALCREIGISQTQLGRWKKDSPKFRQALDTEYRRSQQVSNMNRKSVMRGMLEAVEMAKDMRQPGSMITGWKEIARMCGYYEPERREILLSIDSTKLLEQIQMLPKEKLLELWHENEAVEAKFEVIDAA